MNILYSLIILIISMYIILNEKIPVCIMDILNNNISKIFILFLMIIISVKHPLISILICYAYIITIKNYPKETFGNCLCGNKIKKCSEGQQLIHINGLLPFCGDPNKHLD